VSPSMGEFRFHMREGWHDLMEEAFDTLPLWSGFSTQTCEKIGERLPSVDGCSSAVFAFYPSDSRQPMCFVECTDHLEFMASKVSMALWVQRYPEKVPLMPHTRVFPWDVAVPLTDCASIFTDSEVWVLKRDGSSGGQAVWLVDTLESIEATIKGEQAMLKSLPFHEERDFIPVRRAREERRYRHIALTPPHPPRARSLRTSACTHRAGLSRSTSRPCCCVASSSSTSGLSSASCAARRTCTAGSTRSDRPASRTT
jgi:hypothetical protein